MDLGRVGIAGHPGTTLLTRACSRDAVLGPLLQRLHGRRVEERRPLPNIRLKLPGARKQGRVALPRWSASLSAAPLPCASGYCARSLSAIR